MRFLRLLALATLVALSCSAQSVTGTILGVVADPSGAVIPRASVTATNQATGFTRTASSDDEGNYRLTFLPLGSYRVEAKSAGFGRTLRDGIEVQADERDRVDFSPAVGEAAQTVEVKAGAA